MSARIAVVWNPSKTEKDVLADALAEVQEKAGTVGDTPVSWFETTVDDPGQGATAQALEAGADLILVAGGDGTVRAVAEALADAKADADLGIVPLGTGNLLARNLGVPINDVPAAVERALSGDALPVDVGWVDVDLENGRERHAFVVMIGFGIDAHMIAETNEDLKARAGWLAYVESLGRTLTASDIVPFHLAADDLPGRDEEGHTLLIANCGTLQGGLTLMPDADPSDGELDYLLLSAEGLGEWLGTLKTMVWDNGLGRLIGNKDEATNSDAVTRGRARRIRVTLPDPREFEIDGEGIGKTGEFEVTLQPGAIRVR